jgi:putative hydrolase of the HAD superfamily
MVRAVIFDCFGVLTTDTWLAFLDSLPDSVDIEAARKLNRAHNMGLISNEEYVKGLKEITGHDAKEVQDRLTHEVAKNTILLDYIRELRQRDYRIGLISNVASNWIRESFLTQAEQELFDEMIMSFEVGIAKPDPRMFMLVCERLRVAPHEAVLVDDIERYCDAAHAEGLQAILYKDFKQMKTRLEKLLAA